MHTMQKFANPNTQLFIIMYKGFLAVPQTKTLLCSHLQAYSIKKNTLNTNLHQKSFHDRIHEALEAKYMAFLLISESVG